MFQFFIVGILDFGRLIGVRNLEVCKWQCFLGSSASISGISVVAVADEGQQHKRVKNKKEASKKQKKKFGRENSEREREKRFGNLDFQSNLQHPYLRPIHQIITEPIPQKPQEQNLSTANNHYQQYLQILQNQQVHRDSIDSQKQQIEAAFNNQILDQTIEEYAKPKQKRMGMKSAVGGEIVQVQGGHIVRSTGRKDRHSKVYTAKGPRDRRVRLSAHTAIEFYDVQDRLGYDRPSKAVDWLIKKAKSAIDKLAELPPWDPTVCTAAEAEADHLGAGSSEMAIQAEQSESSGYNFQVHRQLGDNPDNDSSFIAPPMDSNAIADTMKSFFPTNSASSSINFQSYPCEIIQRTANPTQDLGLSLHSFQDQDLIRNHSQGDTNQTPPNDHSLFASYQRMVGWDNNSGTGNREGGSGNGGGFVFNSPPLLQQSLLGHGSAATFSQRGTLQSSFLSPSVRAWDGLPLMASQRTQQPIHHHQASIFGTRFVSDGLPMFCIPARIHGNGEDQHGVVSERPSSSSSPPNSTHH